LPQRTQRTQSFSQLGVPPDGVAGRHGFFDAVGQTGVETESILVYAYWAALGSAPASILMYYTKSRGFRIRDWRS
jgi:hypothetical protein